MCRSPFRIQIWKAPEIVAAPSADMQSFVKLPSNVFPLLNFNFPNPFALSLQTIPRYSSPFVYFFRQLGPERVSMSKLPEMTLPYLVVKFPSSRPFLAAPANRAPFLVVTSHAPVSSPSTKWPLRKFPSLVICQPIPCLLPFLVSPLYVQFLVYNKISPFPLYISSIIKQRSLFFFTSLRLINFSQQVGHVLFTYTVARHLAQTECWLQQIIMGTTLSKSQSSRQIGHSDWLTIISDLKSLFVSASSPYFRQLFICCLEYFLQETQDIALYNIQLQNLAISELVSGFCTSCQPQQSAQQIQKLQFSLSKCWRITVCQDNGSKLYQEYQESRNYPVSCKSFSFPPFYLLFFAFALFSNFSIFTYFIVTTRQMATPNPIMTRLDIRSQKIMNKYFHDPKGWPLKPTCLLALSNVIMQLRIILPAIKIGLSSSTVSPISSKHSPFYFLKQASGQMVMETYSRISSRLGHSSAQLQIGLLLASMVQELKQLAISFLQKLGLTYMRPVVVSMIIDLATMLEQSKPWILKFTIATCHSWFPITGTQMLEFSRKDGSSLQYRTEG